MTLQKRALIVGGTSGIGLAVARRLAAEGRQVVITGRDAVRAQMVADQIGEGHVGLGFDLAEGQGEDEALAEAGAFDHVVLAAVERVRSAVAAHDIVAAQRPIALGWWAIRR